jgi:Glycosyltransferase like family 2
MLFLRESTHGMSSSHQSRVAWFGIVFPTVLLWSIYIPWCIASLFDGGSPWWVDVLLGYKLVVELVALFYMVCFTFASLAYLRRPQDAQPDGPIRDHLGSAAVLYFCCNDLDPDALLSLAMLQYAGQLRVIVHDDSQAPQEHARVDRVATEVAQRSGREVLVLRRPHHEGGKPGAVQYVLEHTHDLHEFCLMADNDSYALSPDVLARAVSRFDHEHIAVVQCRNHTRQLAEDGPLARALAWSIDIFDVLMTGLFSYLWCPFVGHNAVLRTRAVLGVGGMTPGCFADDIDLSVRLQDRGYTIRYCPDLVFGETHHRHAPQAPSFRLFSEAFRIPFALCLACTREVGTVQ